MHEVHLVWCKDFSLIMLHVVLVAMLHFVGYVRVFFVIWVRGFVNSEKYFDKNWPSLQKCVLANGKKM